MSHRIAILGSTGSVGSNALDVVERLGRPYRVTAISGHRQPDRLLHQVMRHRPSAAAVGDDASRELVSRIEALGCRVYSGSQGLVEMVRRDDIDVVLSAIAGAAGVPAALATVGAGKRLALANKEALVAAGALVIPLARNRNAKILPVDSEHSAIFQAMHCGRLSEVRRVILTASGGPFRNTPLEQMHKATPADALNHPTWPTMGGKITIDSATMFNKALEIIEACWLFDLSPQQVEVVVHPESIVHSMVEFVDGSVIAQLSPPDMRTPIQYALTYPDRLDGLARRLDLSKKLNLHFEPPDFDRFPALRLAYDVAHRGGDLGAVLNAANEEAVAAFTSGKIAFGEISRVVELTIESHKIQPLVTLDDLLEADKQARITAQALMQESLIRN